MQVKSIGPCPLCGGDVEMVLFNTIKERSVGLVEVVDGTLQERRLTNVYQCNSCGHGATAFTTVGMGGA